MAAWVFKSRSRIFPRSDALPRPDEVLQLPAAVMGNHLCLLLLQPMARLPPRRVGPCRRPFTCGEFSCSRGSVAPLNLSVKLQPMALGSAASGFAAHNWVGRGAAHPSGHVQTFITRSPA